MFLRRDGGGINFVNGVGLLDGGDNALVGSVYLKVALKIRESVRGREFGITVNSEFDCFVFLVPNTLSC